MIETSLMIGAMPAVVYGEPSERAFLFVHGQYGNKEEARGFAETAAGRGWQTISVDLPGHGARADEKDTFFPWVAVPELQAVMGYMEARWRVFGLRATSIGAWFSLLALPCARFSGALLAAPLLDMEGLIRGGMARNGISEARLRAEGEIPVPGDTLSWRYLSYAMEHTPLRWTSPASILCPEHDEVTPLPVSRRVAAENRWTLTVPPGSPHWIHRPDDVAFLRRWEAEGLSAIEKGAC